MAHPRFRHKPLLIASTKEAVVYLELLGFTVGEDHISCNGRAMATHRTLFAIDWLFDHGFTYDAPERVLSKQCSARGSNRPPWATNISNGNYRERAMMSDLIPKAPL
jgi:hypothetical protein